MYSDCKASKVCKTIKRTAPKKVEIVIGFHFKMCLKNLSLISEIPVTVRKTYWEQSAAAAGRGAPAAPGSQLRAGTALRRAGSAALPSPGETRAEPPPKVFALPRPRRAGARPRAARPLRTRGDGGARRGRATGGCRRCADGALRRRPRAARCGAAALLRGVAGRPAGAGRGTAGAAHTPRGGAEPRRSAPSPAREVPGAFSPSVRSAAGLSSVFQPS